MGNEPNARDEGLRRRFKQVVEEHGLSRISRRAGIPSSSLSRYVQGRRIPASACIAPEAALV